MDVEEAEDLRLGIAEGVPDGAGLSCAVFGQLDDELHAQGPLAAGVALGQCRDSRRWPGRRRRRGRRRQRSGAARTSMPGMKPSAGAAGFVDALVGEAQAFATCWWRIAASKSGSATGVPGQICTRPVAMICEATHWLNWPMESMQAVRACGGRRESRAVRRRGRLRRAGRGCEGSVGRAQRERSGGWRRWGRGDRGRALSATAVAMGISAGLRSGKLERMPRARVTTPLTPEASRRRARSR